MDGGDDATKKRRSAGAESPMWCTHHLIREERTNRIESKNQGRQQIR